MTTVAEPGTVWEGLVGQHRAVEALRTAARQPHEERGTIGC